MVSGLRYSQPLARFHWHALPSGIWVKIKQLIKHDFFNLDQLPDLIHKTDSQPLAPGQLGGWSPMTNTRATWTGILFSQQTWSCSLKTLAMTRGLMQWCKARTQARKGREQVRGYFDKLEVTKLHIPGEIFCGLEFIRNWIKKFKPLSNYFLWLWGYKGC